MAKRKPRVIGTYAGPLEAAIVRKSRSVGVGVGIVHDHRMRAEGCMPMDMLSLRMIELRRKKNQ